MLVGQSSPIVQKEATNLVGQSSPIVQKDSTNLVGQSSPIVQKTISHGQSGTIDLPEKNASAGQSGTIDLPEKNISAGLSGTIDIPEIYAPISEFKITKRHLPHWQNPGAFYFITAKSKDYIFSDEEKTIIYNAILFHNYKKYNLLEFVVMPDHFHIILQPINKDEFGFFSLSEINHSIKSYTAKIINKINQTHIDIWRNESYDRIIRNENELHKFQKYIYDNPVKKGLTANIFEYKWFYFENK